MADSFQQRISLEGAEDIIKQLQRMGQAGTEAIGQLQKSLQLANPALQNLSNASKTAQQSIVNFGGAVSQLNGVIGPLSSGLGGILGIFGQLAGSGGVLAAVGGIALLIKSAADSAVAADRQAKALGLTIEQMQGIKRVAKDAGLSTDELNTALTRFAGQVSTEAQAQFKGLIDLAKNISGQFAGANLRIINLDDIRKLREAIAQVGPQLQASFKAAGNPLGNLLPDAFIQRIVQIASRADDAGAAMRKMVEAATGLSTALTPFEKLDDLVVKNEAGIKSLRTSFLNAQGQEVDTLEALLRVADQLNKLPDGLQKTALASKLFGRSVGPDLAAAFSQGRGSIETIIDALAKQGISIDKDGVQKARELKKAFNDLDQSTKTLGKSLLLNFGPALTNGINATATDIQNLKKLLTGTFDVKLTNPFTAEGGIFNVTGLFESIKNAATQAFQFIKDGFTSAFGEINLDLITTRLQAIWDSVKAAASTAWANIQAIASQAFDGIAQTASELPGQIGAALANLGEAIVAPFRTAIDTIRNLWDTVISKIREVLGLGSSASQQASGAGSGGGGGEGFARGGFIWGPGTATSDSILARLSRGEFVINARAVAHFGRDFFAALNAMRVPSAPRFNLGGLVEGMGASLAASLAVPRFAAGGLVDFAPAGAAGRLHPVTINFNGQNVKGLLAPADVVGNLRRAGANAQIASGGTKPSWYR